MTARFGALVLRPRERPKAMVYDVSATAAIWLGAQGTIINQAELFATPVLAWSTPDDLRGADII
eukprot:8806273-Lingulodinium_polyedra.AAC.1